MTSSGLASAAGINGDGAIIWQQTHYDAMGRADRKSNPYYDGAAASALWTTTTGYDLLNRPAAIQTPDDENTTTGYQTTSFTYSGLTTTATDPAGRVSVTTKNTQGWTILNTRNRDSAAGAPATTVTYTYDAAGTLLTTVAAGTTTSLAYDNRGRKVTMVDPDMGTWQYRYNIFGELIWQKDAKGSIVRLSYDALGRMATRTEPEGTTTWAYDTAPGKSLGKLASVAVTATGTSGAYGGLAGESGAYTETYEYDSLGRPSITRRTLPGVVCLLPIFL